MQYSHEESEVIGSTEERSFRAKEIASRGNYFHIVEELHEEGIFEQEQAALKAEYGARLTEQWITERDWEMLTVLGLYDRATLRHCIGTFELAKKKITQDVYGPRGERIVLSERIEEEGVSVTQFLRACLLHDIGKVEIPHFAIRNTTTTNEWNVILQEIMHRDESDQERAIICAKLGLEVSFNHDEDSIRAAETRSGLRPIALVPAKYALSETDIAHASERGFSVEETLASIIEHHEASSGAILDHHGCTIESELACHHHNYEHGALTYQFTSELLQIGVTRAGGSIIDILRAADVEEALRSKERSYKEAYSPLETLIVIIEDALRNPQSQYVSYLWIASDLKEINKEEIYRNAEGGDLNAAKEKERYETVLGFLHKIEADTEGGK